MGNAQAGPKQGLFWGPTKAQKAVICRPCCFYDVGTLQALSKHLSVRGPRTAHSKGRDKDSALSAGTGDRGALRGWDVLTWPQSNEERQGGVFCWQLQQPWVGCCGWAAAGVSYANECVRALPLAGPWLGKTNLSRHPAFPT